MNLNVLKKKEKIATLLRNVPLFRCSISLHLIDIYLLLSFFSFLRFVDNELKKK